ncbi:MAG: crossover junction endodeoxyribonuclease RuvC [Fibrobacterota bacterium]
MFREKLVIIFGIDLGTVATGYGVIRVVNNSVSWVDSGVITPDSSRPLCERLASIYDGLSRKMLQHTPQRVCIEEAFYGKNVHTTLVLGHARGVAMLAAVKCGAQVSEYTPRVIKKTVAGNGNAAKEQVMYMIKMLLSPPCDHARSDAYDALAIAMCDFHHSRNGTALSMLTKRKRVKVGR